jgi:hypothetical protein
LIESPTVTLTGGGTLVISNNPNNYVQATTTGYVLDNVNNTIEGAGNFGQGNMGLTNGGLIDADDSNTLYVNLVGAVLNTATGTLLASGSGGMLVQGGTYTNDGVFQANDGSALSFTSSATLTNDSATGTLTGGTYAAYANGHGATLSLAGTAVTTLDATVILSGAGSALSFGGTSIATKLVTIEKAGALEILNGASYTSTTKITNNGTILLGGGTFKSKSLTNKTGALLEGFGTVGVGLVGGGAVDATGLLVLAGKNNSLTGTVSGTGTLELNKYITTLAAGAALDVSNVAMIGGASLNLTTAISFAGTLDITGKYASLVEGTGSFANSGLFEQDTGQTSTVSAAFSNSGTVDIAAGTLAFTGGLANTGTILDKTIFTDTAALTGGTLTVDGSAAAASIATTAGAGNSTIALLNLEGGGALNTNGTTLTVTGNYTNSATGTGNSYNADAGITGTIDGQGAVLGVIGVRGTHLTTVNGTLTITVNAGGKAYFEIKNTGTSGAEVSGALQTSVNGGNITSPGLTGNGVTAGNFQAIAAGGTSGLFTIDYSSGTLTDQSIHLISDFANVAGITIDIVAGTGGAAPPAPAMAAAVPHDAAATLPWLHMGGSHWG